MIEHFPSSMVGVWEKKIEIHLTSPHSMFSLRGFPLRRTPRREPSRCSQQFGVPSLHGF